ncbi:MAG TPA: hypothetical protein VHD14_16035 [Pseudolabrys sp.]|jgi:hypothetical protein|nr:hypothetical protein [Pseudolabrys sp.]
MRALLISLTAIFLIAAVSSAQSAERRMFIISSNADGYGVDRCLATGAKCGGPIATAYCRARDFAQATSFRKVDRDEITGAIPAGASGCTDGKCDDLVAIVCAR